MLSFRISESSLFEVGSHLPEGISLRGEQAEILLGQLDGREGLHLQVGPGFDEHHQAFEGVQTEPVVTVV